MFGKIMPGDVLPAHPSVPAYITAAGNFAIMFYLRGQGYLPSEQHKKWVPGTFYTYNGQPTQWNGGVWVTTQVASAKGVTSPGGSGMTNTSWCRDEYRTERLNSLVEPLPSTPWASDQYATADGAAIRWDGTKWVFLSDFPPWAASTAGKAKSQNGTYISENRLTAQDASNAANLTSYGYDPLDPTLYFKATYDEFYADTGTAWAQGLKFIWNGTQWIAYSAVAKTAAAPGAVITDAAISALPYNLQPWAVYNMYTSTATVYNPGEYCTIAGRQYCAYSANGAMILGPRPTTAFPSNVSLHLWLDAADPQSFSYSSGNLVSQWRDKCGFNNHFSQATTAMQPSRNGTQNGRTCVVFDGVDDVMKSASAVTTFVDNVTLYVACRRTGGNSSNSVPFYHGVPQTNGWGPALLTDGTNVGMLRGGIAWHPTATPNPAAPCVMSLRRTAGTWSLRINGVATNLAAIDAPAAPTTSSSIVSDQHFFGGQIYEVLSYGAAHTDAERAGMENYLRTKWGTA
jgi:hypothetical protein